MLVFFNAILSIADIASILLVFIILNLYNGDAGISLSTYLQIFHFKQQSLVPAFFLMIVFITKSIAGYFIIKHQTRYIAGVSTRLSSTNLLLYFEGKYVDFVNTDSSVWMRKIYFQAVEFSQYVLSGVQQIINETILILITVIALLIYNAKVLAIVILVLLPAIFLLLYITKKRLGRARKNIKTANEISLQYLTESISGFVESNVYNKNTFFTDRYKKSQFILNRLIADMQVIQLLPTRFFEIFAILGLFIIVLINFNLGDTSQMYLLGAFIAAAYKIIPGISKIINYSNQVRTYLFTTKDLSTNIKLSVTQDTNSPLNSIEKIEFKNVCFNYNEKEVLTDFNCTIHSRNFVGIKGISGKGKTTFIDLLLGFLSPQKGKIFFNDELAKSNEIKKFWPQIAYVKQTNFLLHDSVLNNIILSESNYNQQKLHHIIQVTGLKNWLDDLHDGINTIINENGKNISGGQKQRIAIARALYKDAPLLILDEPFNELDENSETSLLHYFKCLSKKGKTVLLITHNTNSFNFCDRIINLDEKR